MTRNRLTFGCGSCRNCNGWGDLRYDGACWPCVLWERKIRDPRQGACRRCTHEGTLTYEDVCRPCMIEIHYADHDWVVAVLEGGAVPVRALQLALLLPEVKFAAMQPLHKRGSVPKLALLPRTRDWKAAHQREERTDDLRLCPPQIKGQLALLVMERTFQPGDPVRIKARVLPDEQVLLAVARRLQAELRRHSRWAAAVMPLARLALAAREADEELVREEVVDRLPGDRLAVALVLREAGLLQPRSTPRQPTPRRRMIGPRRQRSDAKKPRQVRQRPESIARTCSECLAWGRGFLRRCLPCQSWSARKPRPTGPCIRCQREMPLEAGRCRACHLAVAAGSPVDRVVDQLWLGTEPHRPPMPIRQQEAVREPAPGHLAVPGQDVLFPAPERDWRRLRGQPLPELTPAARALMDALERQARGESWVVQTRRANLRVLRTALAVLGADHPIAEDDIRAIARIGTNYAGLRVIHFLESQGMLVPRPGRDIGMDQAAAARLLATAPTAYRDDLDAWVRVMRGQGRRRTLAITWPSVRRYIGYVLPVLAEWERAFPALSAVDKNDVVKAIEARPGSRGRAAHSGLRSLFRALKYERRIFHDPARNVHLGAKPAAVPRPIPDAQLAGILDAAATPSARFAIALVAIHAVRPLQLTRLRLDDLDRTKGRLAVGERTAYLDELTLQLATDWLADRYRQWPASRNPHLFVTRRTAMHTGHPPVSKFAILYAFQQVGPNPSAIAIDRLLDEADHSEDPLHLMKVFDISVSTAIKYVQAAHPERCGPDPISP